MSPDTARRTLRDYRRARAALHEAVRVLAEHGVTQTEIAAVSGLSRDGVRKILSRQRVQ